MVEKKLHIAIISTWFPTPANTSGVFVRDQADALIDAGNKVSVFMFQYFSPMAWLKKKIKGEPLNQWIGSKNTNPLAYDFVNFSPTRFSSNPIEVQKKAFLNYIDKSFSDYIQKNGKPDVIHHHGVADYCYVTTYLSKQFNIPYVITEHSMFIDKVDHFTAYETKEERLEMIKYAGVRMAVSNFYAKFNSELFHAPFITMPNMINNDFANTPLPSFPKKNNPFYFLNIGALSRRKRQDILIQAFADAFKGNKEIQLVIAGNGELESDLKKLITSLGMNEQIQLAGYKEKNEVIELLDKSNVIVISSEKESFSMAAAEALFRGNPVLTTLCKGPEDFINENNGLTCQINDVDDMKEKLLDIYKQYSSYKHLQITEDARKQYSEQVIARKLEEVYRQAISLSSPPA
jgi:glycosyltransferase involved in cell wall biosynthesis